LESVVVDTSMSSSSWEGFKVKTLRRMSMILKLITMR